MKSDNPHSGIYEADTSRTLSINGGNPACNQGGICVLEGNGQRESHKGDGYAESEISYTLNTIERHAVCCKQDATEPAYETYQKTTGTLSPGAHAGSYNRQDAYNDMLVCSPQNAVCCTQDAYDKFTENENSASLKANGGNYGGGERDVSDTVGALCARDYKGVGNQYVQEGKVIIQSAHNDRR